MNGKDFEKLCQLQMDREERLGRATMSRCGVHAVHVDGQWTPIHSLPDFAGVLLGGREFVFDCKVCHQASFPLDDDKFKARQLKHMLTRSRFGSVCFLLIHFPARPLKTREVAALTVAFPVCADHQFWNRVWTGEAKRITREDALEYGIEVQWTTPKGKRGKPKPDLWPAIMELGRRAIVAPLNSQNAAPQRTLFSEEELEQP